MGANKVRAGKPPRERLFSNEFLMSLCFLSLTLRPSSLVFLVIVVSPTPHFEGIPECLCFLPRSRAPNRRSSNGDIKGDCSAIIFRVLSIIGVFAMHILSSTTLLYV